MLRVCHRRRGVAKGTSQDWLKWNMGVESYQQKNGFLIAMSIWYRHLLGLLELGIANSLSEIQVCSDLGFLYSKIERHTELKEPSSFSEPFHLFLLFYIQISLKKFFNFYLAVSSNYFLLFSFGIWDIWNLCYESNACIAPNSYVKALVSMWLYLKMGPLKKLWRLTEIIRVESWSDRISALIRGDTRDLLFSLSPSFCPHSFSPPNYVNILKKGIVRL